MRFFQTFTDVIDGVVIPENQRESNNCEQSEVRAKPRFIDVCGNHCPYIDPHVNEWEYIEEGESRKVVEVGHVLVVGSPVFKEFENLVIDEGNDEHNDCLGKLQVPNDPNKFLDILVETGVCRVLFKQNHKGYECRAREGVDDSSEDALSLQNIRIWRISSRWILELGHGCLKAAEEVEYNGRHQVSNESQQLDIAPLPEFDPVLSRPGIGPGLVGMDVEDPVDTQVDLGHDLGKHEHDIRHRADHRDVERKVVVDQDLGEEDGVHEHKPPVGEPGVGILDPWFCRVFGHRHKSEHGEQHCELQRHRSKDNLEPVNHGRSKDHLYKYIFSNQLDSSF